MSAESEITRLLVRWKGGDEDALGQLLPVVYEELRTLARGYLRRERRGHTLQPTALVHELFIRLRTEGRLADWQDRAHFFGVAARAMRQILIAHARRRHAVKRGGANDQVYIADVPEMAVRADVDLIALDAALSALASQDARQAQVVELRVFGGYTIEETAQILGCSAATVSRDWQTARAWLYRELRGRSHDA